MPKFVQTLFHTDTRLVIRTSRHDSPRKQVYLTLFAVAISLAGFLFQFVGLRALAWQVTIVQLAATGAMTSLRTAVRRDLLHEPKVKEIKVSGYELEAMAMEINGCHKWEVTTWKPGPGGGLNAAENFPASEPSTPAGGSGVAANGSRFASEVMGSRLRLGSLSMWPSGCQKTAGIVAQAIEASMNFLLTNPDVTRANTRPPNVFEWNVFVEVSKAPGGEGGSINTFVQMRLSRKTLPNGTRGLWKAVRNEIEAVLGLWMYHLKRLQSEEGSLAPNIEGDWRQDEQAMGISKTHRIVGSGDPANEKIYKRWLLPQTEIASTDAESIIGRPNSHGAQCLAALSETPLELICGQHIYSTFLAHVVGRVVDSMNGKVLARGSEQGKRDSIGLRNTVIEGLLKEVERTGLATPEDALLSIVPALWGKFSTSVAATEAFSDLASEISAHLEDGRFERAEVLLLWLLDTTMSGALRHEKEQNWREACKAYILLLKTYATIGSDSYTSRAEEALGLFCERHHSSHRTDDEGATRRTLSLVEEVLGEVKMSSWEGGGQTLEARLKGREQARYLVSTGTAGERFRWAAASGDYLGVMKELHAPDIDINSPDSRGRTSLILACRFGQANITNATTSECRPMSKGPIRQNRYSLCSTEKRYLSPTRLVAP